MSTDAIDVRAKLLVALPPMASVVLMVPALASLPTSTEAVTVDDGHGGFAPVRGAEAVPPAGTLEPDHPAVQTVVSALPGAAAHKVAKTPKRGKIKKLRRTGKAKICLTLRVDGNSNSANLLRLGKLAF